MSTIAEIRTILFPCDLTAHSAKILDYTFALAQTFGSRIQVLHVVPDLRDWAGLYMPHKRLELEQKEVVESARKSLVRFCDNLLGDRAPLPMLVVSGDPAVEIIQAAKQEGADLIVMGTHGRKGLEFSLFGSVAAKVVRHSPVPVLTINPEHLKPQEAAPPESAVR